MKINNKWTLSVGYMTIVFLFVKIIQYICKHNFLSLKNHKIFGHKLIDSFGLMKAIADWLCLSNGLIRTKNRVRVNFLPHRVTLDMLVLPLSSSLTHSTPFLTLAVILFSLQICEGIFGKLCKKIWYLHYIIQHNKW